MCSLPVPEWIVDIQGIRVEVANLQLVEILQEILEGHPEFSVSLKYTVDILLKYLYPVNSS
jgi:hypothetical protein